MDCERIPEPLDVGAPPSAKFGRRRNSKLAFVPMKQILGVSEGWAELSVREIRNTYRLIQRLKRIRHLKGGGDPTEYETEGEDKDAVHVPTDATAEDAALLLIKRRCIRLRPDTPWRDIAESLGITNRTLWKRRIKAFPEGHPLHPQSGNTCTHSKEN